MNPYQTTLDRFLRPGIPCSTSGHRLKTLDVHLLMRPWLVAASFRAYSFAFGCKQFRMIRAFATKVSHKVSTRSVSPRMGYLVSQSIETESDNSRTVTRRNLMESGVAGVGAIALSALTATSAAAHGTLASHTEIDNDNTYYEIGGAASAFSYNAGFYSRLETWAQFFYNNTPGTWLKPIRLWTYGVHVDKGSASHDYGRGFDLSRIYATVGGALTLVSYQRYDIWRTYTGNQLTTYRRWYWGTAASACYHFQYVLHYLYNTDHWNHIHIDNLVSGTGNSTFNTTSTTQVKFVQASLNYVWGYPVTIDGVWGSQTSSYASQAIARGGGSGSLTASQTNWLLFCRTTTRYGTGAQAY